MPVLAYAASLLLATRPHSENHSVSSTSAVTNKVEGRAKGWQGYAYISNAFRVMICQQVKMQLINLFPLFGVLLKLA